MSWAFAGNLALFAQLAPLPLPPVVWDGDRVVIADQGGFRISMPHGQPERRIPYPENTVDARFARGWFWCVQRDTKGNRFVLSRSEQGKEWEIVAIYQERANQTLPSIVHICPIDDDWFLMSARHDGFQIGHSTAPIVVARVDEKRRLNVHEAVDIGIDPRKEWPIWVNSMVLTPPFLVTQDRVYLKCERIGRFWEISPRGRVKREIRLFSTLDDERIKKIETFDWAVICIQPNREGDLVFVSFPEDLVLNGQTIIPRPYNKNTVFGSGADEAAKKDAQLLRMLGNLAWWKIDHETGGIHPMAPPSGVPTRLKSAEHVRRFAFEFSPEGNLVFPRMTNRSESQ